MIRTHILPCQLPAAQTRALNQESGRIYTATLVHHWRIYRQRAKVWLSPFKHNRVLDFFCGPSPLLHAHSVDAAQQDFYKGGAIAVPSVGMSAIGISSAAPISCRANSMGSSPRFCLQEHKSIVTRFDGQA